MKAAALKFNEAKAGFFRFRRLGKKVLITNDIGHYALLGESDFSRFVRGTLRPKEKLHMSLSEQGFIRDFTDFDRLVEEWRKRNRFLWQGPSLHIVVVTLRCDHKCVYCQTSSVSMKERGFDMTARRSPSSSRAASPWRTGRRCASSCVTPWRGTRRRRRPCGSTW